MDKKLEYHKEYSEAAYKDRVYKWFNDNTSTLDDADLQKFLDLCMRGNLTFQCADEIGIDDPDLSMIDHLLMDIASEKNNELINIYTDEIDWDNDYIEKYNRYSSMDKKLEARIARLERLLTIKNENMELDNLAKRIEALFNKRRISAEVKAYSDDVTVIFDWEPDPGYFTIKPSEDGGYEVEDEYYVERFDTIQQVIDYLVKKDNDNAR